jgi:cell pole-organizing protein PopZ
VLSSIRRLVSEHPENAQGASGRGKLMLTPAQRVGDANDRPGPAPANAPKPEPTASDAEDRPGAQETYSLEQRIAELEEAIAASAGEWEPDGSETGAGGLPSDMPPVFSTVAPANDPANDRPRDRAWTNAQPEPDAAPATEPRPGARTEAPATESPASMFEDDREETVLDEEMLRDLVAELVREELQGALGERITRNVRKLVRAEVQRALATRDLG